MCRTEGKVKLAEKKIEKDKFVISLFTYIVKELKIAKN